MHASSLALWIAQWCAMKVSYQLMKVRKIDVIGKASLWGCEVSFTPLDKCNGKGVYYCFQEASLHPSWEEDLLLQLSWVPDRLQNVFCLIQSSIFAIRDCCTILLLHLIFHSCTHACWRPHDALTQVYMYDYMMSNSILHFAFNGTFLYHFVISLYYLATPLIAPWKVY